MQVDIQMIITQGDQKTTHDVLCFEREELSIETLGLTLKESKAMTAEIQKKMIEAQVKGYLSNHMDCTQCGKLRLIKSYHNMALLLKSKLKESCSLVYDFYQILTDLGMPRRVILLRIVQRNIDSFS